MGVGDAAGTGEERTGVGGGAGVRGTGRGGALDSTGVRVPRSLAPASGLGVVVVEATGAGTGTDRCGVPCVAGRACPCAVPAVPVPRGAAAAVDEACVPGGAPNSARPPAVGTADRDPECVASGAPSVADAVPVLPQTMSAVATGRAAAAAKEVPVRCVRMLLTCHVEG